MSIKPRYITVIVVWLVVAGLIIIPRFIFKQPIATAATNATNADIVNAINNLQTNLQYTIYAAIAIIVTALK